MKRYISIVVFLTACAGARSGDGPDSQLSSIFPGAGEGAGDGLLVSLAADASHVEQLDADAGADAEPGTDGAPEQLDAGPEQGDAGDGAEPDAEPEQLDAGADACTPNPCDPEACGPPPCPLLAELAGAECILGEPCRAAGSFTCPPGCSVVGVPGQDQFWDCDPEMFGERRGALICRDNNGNGGHACECWP